MSRVKVKKAPSAPLFAGVKLRPKLCRANAKAGAGLYDGLVVDYFAGGGGASTALEIALGRAPDVAVNHDEGAIAMHEANHPECRHYTKDVFEVDPVEVTGGRQVDVLWASPDCTHFSRAKGAKPVKKKIRGLAWAVVRFCAALGRKKPKVFFLENVKEFEKWGPLLHAKGQVRSGGAPKPDYWPSLSAKDRQRWLAGFLYDKDGGRVMIPNKKREGETFRRFVRMLRALGYNVEWREVNAADHGAPTHRRRLFMVGRCDGRPIRWPKPTHGPGRKRKWRSAAECINWKLPAPSIFLDRPAAKALRKATGIRCNRPLKPKTLKRVANGIVRYVINSKKPFIVRTGHWSNKTGAGSGFRGQDTRNPLGAVCSVNDKALTVPYLIAYYSQGSGVTGHSAAGPMPTATAKGRFGLATPYLVRTNHGTTPGTDDHRGQQLKGPLHTLTAAHGTGAVVPILTQYFGGSPASRGKEVDGPVPTITADDHNGLIAAHLTQMYGRSVGQDPAAPAPSVTAGVRHTGVVAAHLSQVGHRDDNKPGRPVDEPVNTLLQKGRHLLTESVLAPLVATVSHTGTTGRGKYVDPATDPTKTLTTSNDKALLAVHLVQHYGGVVGKPVRDPTPCITATDHNGLVTAHLVQYNSEKPGETRARGQDVDAPVNTIPTENRFALAEVTAACITRIGQQGSNGGHVSDPRSPLTTVVSKQEHLAVAASLVKFRGDSAGQPVTEPAPTITAGGDCKRDAGAAHATGVTAAHLVKLRGSRGWNKADKPLDTVVAGATTFGTVESQLFAVEDPATAAAMVQMNHGQKQTYDAAGPVRTVTAGGNHEGIAAAAMVKFNHGDKQWSGADEPVRTVLSGANHHALAEAALAAQVDAAVWAAFHHVWDFLKEQLGPDAPAPIVHHRGQTYLIVDIGLRMLTPRELLNAQFSPELAKRYVLTGTDAEQVRRIGNSVSPPPAAALVKANCGRHYGSGRRAA